MATLLSSIMRIYCIEYWLLISDVAGQRSTIVCETYGKSSDHITSSTTRLYLTINAEI